MRKLAHNLSVRSDYAQDQERWLHQLVIVVSDVNDESELIEKSEQFNMLVQPVMEPDQCINALRALADSIEQYMKESGNEVG